MEFPVKRPSRSRGACAQYRSFLHQWTTFHEHNLLPGGSVSFAVCSSCCLVEESELHIADVLVSEKYFSRGKYRLWITNFSSICKQVLFNSHFIFILWHVGTNISRRPPLLSNGSESISRNAFAASHFCRQIYRMTYKLEICGSTEVIKFWSVCLF